LNNLSARYDVMKQSINNQNTKKKIEENGELKKSKLV